jgi:hypothetical protein
MNPFTKWDQADMNPLDTRKYRHFASNVKISDLIQRKHSL